MKRIKSEARRARPDGHDESISMGRTKGKPISCIGPLRENKEPMKIEPKRWEIPEKARLNEGFLYGGMTCPPCLGFLK